MLQLKKSFHSVAGKLILAVGALMVLGSAIFGYIFIRYEEKIMMTNLVSNAATTTDLVKRGVYQGMLTSHRDAIRQTVEVFGSASGIRGITIYDKKGTVIYASDKAAVGTRTDLNHETCRLCHPKGAPAAEMNPANPNWRIGRDNAGERALIMAHLLVNEPSCATAACHYHKESQRVLGVIETSFSTATVDATIRQNRIGTVLFGGLFFMMISFSLCVILYKFVTGPVSRLDEGMKRIARGDLAYVINIPSDDEMGLLAQTFNSMAKDIKNYRENMENWTKALEEEVQKKTAEIVRAHDQLINAEKLASLGRMAAGVAHELNSPLTGIVTFAHLMLKRVPPDNKQDIEDLEVIIEQANRCSKIIKGLLGFSRKATAEKAMVSVNALVEGTVAMVRNQAKFHNIKINLVLDPSIPPIAVDPNQLQQVFLNLLINAADAMNERGQITIGTRTTGGDMPEGLKQGYPQEAEQYVEIEFADTGPGIPEEHLSKIFEPFFTTKPVGKGTGLGLAVSYGIIKKHGGNIFVRSESGKGARFFVRLPIEAVPAEIGTSQVVDR